jgi:hypothetical protein
MQNKNKSKVMSQKEIRLAVDNGHVEIKNWTHLHSEFEKTRDTGWIFRGVTSPSHYLVPSIGREGVFGRYKKAQEERLFEEFKNRAIALMRDGRFNDWDWLAYAQHIGVPTRLLDWTASPLAATFFAVESDTDEDRVIYAVMYSKYIFEIDHKQCGPFENATEGRFTAPLAFDRIRAQRGLFTIHPDPTLIFYPRGLKTWLIKASLASDFRRRLFKYGFDYWHMYPDHQGLGLQLAWQFRHKVGLGSVFSAPAKANNASSAR